MAGVKRAGPGPRPLGAEERGSSVAPVLRSACPLGAESPGPAPAAPSWRAGAFAGWRRGWGERGSLCDSYLVLAANTTLETFLEDATNWGWRGAAGREGRPVPRRGPAM